MFIDKALPEKLGGGRGKQAINNVTKVKQIAGLRKLGLKPPSPLPTMCQVYSPSPFPKLDSPVYGLEQYYNGKLQGLKTKFRTL